MLMTSPAQLTAIPKTPITHAHRRRLNHPIPATSATAASTQNGSAMNLPRGISCTWPDLFSSQARSRNVPGQPKVIAANVAHGRGEEEKDSVREETNRAVTIRCHGLNQDTA
jgi:hypothetical protein